MELPGRKSDLLPTRMIGTLGGSPRLPGMGELVEARPPPHPPGPCPLPGPPLGPSIHQRDPFGSDLKGKTQCGMRGPPSPWFPPETPA